MNKNIVLKHTLEEYTKKYCNRRYRLIKYTVSQVEEFDKKYPTNIKHYLLSKRKFWLIGDTYYEVPKAPRLTWFRNLNSAVQLTTCLLGAGIITTAITVPTVMLNNHEDKKPEPQPIIVEEEVSLDGANAKKVKIASSSITSKGAAITIKANDDNETVGFVDVKKGTNLLSIDEYDFNRGKEEININKDVLDKYEGKIKITPYIVSKQLESQSIDWLGSKTELDNTSPFGLAQSANYIEIGSSLKHPNPDVEFASYKFKGVEIAEESKSGIKLYYGTIDNVNKLYILSDKKIKFEDNDGSGQWDRFFYSCKNAKCINLENIETSSITSFMGFFMSCEKLESVVLSNFDTSNATSLRCLFSNCTKLNKIIGLDSFNTKKS